LIPGQELPPDGNNDNVTEKPNTWGSRKGGNDWTAQTLCYPSV